MGGGAHDPSGNALSLLMRQHLDRVDHANIVVHPGKATPAGFSFQRARMPVLVAARSITARRAGPTPPAAQTSAMIASGSQMQKAVTGGIGKSVSRVIGRLSTVTGSTTS